jgi:hypothetical protein
VLASPRPLRALWESSTGPRDTVFTIEFAALANQRKALRAVVLMTAVSRILVMEDHLGLTAGQPETVALVDRLIEECEGGPRLSR